MTKLNSRSIAAAAAMIATIVVATPLRAETMSDIVQTRAVAYADLDLSTASGRAMMDRRIRHVAASVCGPLELSNRMSVQACRARAIAGAGVRLAAVQDRKSMLQLAAAR